MMRRYPWPVPRVLSCIQPTGVVHLGNYLGALRNWVVGQHECDAFHGIVDLHALTVTDRPGVLGTSTLELAATLFAVGLDPEVATVFVQSHVPEHAQLGWVMECTVSYGELSRMTQFKDKSAKREADFVSAGLFTYPALQAADILLYDAEIVPVGKDQKQHIEMARDVANRFNLTYGDTFVLPEEQIQPDTMLIPGTDGEKMSKSRNNFIDIFLPEKQLRKQIMSIVSDSTPLEEPKNTETCHTFALYKLLASPAQIEQMTANYHGGNYGYGHAKQALFELIVEKFKNERERYNYYMSNLTEVDELLRKGAQKASNVANGVLAKVRAKLGFEN